MTQMDAQESEETPRSMSSDQRSTEVVAMASSSKGAKASISKGAVIAANEMSWTQILVEVPELPPSLRGSVSFCSSKVLLH